MVQYGIIIVRPRVCFHCGVFCIPKNGTLKTKKPPTIRVMGDALAYSKNLLCYNNIGLPTALSTKEVIRMDGNSLSHTKWNCKYHIVFVPKFRRKIVYGKLKQDIANILRMFCKRKKVKIVEAEVCLNHIHMVVKIPPSLRVSSFVGHLKEKITLMIFERHANLKYKYGNTHFWCRGYYVDTIGKNTKKIQKYMRNQLKEKLEYNTTR